MKVDAWLMRRRILIGFAIGSFVVALAIVGAGAWEIFGGMGRRMHVVSVPGFHDLDIKAGGLHVGVYQHRGREPLPIAALARLDVRMYARDRFEEVPVEMNRTGQTFSRMGVVGMPLFTFFAPRAGGYALSAVYLGEEAGPRGSVVVFSATVQNIKQTVFVALFFFVIFAGIGGVILYKLNAWAPRG